MLFYGEGKWSWYEGLIDYACWLFPICGQGLQKLKGKWIWRQEKGEVTYKDSVLIESNTITLYTKPSKILCT